MSRVVSLKSIVLNTVTLCHALIVVIKIEIKIEKCNSQRKLENNFAMKLSRKRNSQGIRPFDRRTIDW